ncbi:hypothetical protein FG379_001210 [Cryptosporidium bovis]|uniref:uncharacterized protein n=1 Tax=Cryptosporidium bovis TaxID=310047 RepID=UPI00351A4363|nr:hypothetical protein FG379_001210 [Cryptosporidium bovis]
MEEKDPVSVSKPLIKKSVDGHGGNKDFNGFDYEMETAKKNVSLSLFIKFVLIASLIHGFNEKVFYSVMFYENFEQKDPNLLRTEKMLFIQHIISCIGFIVWGVGYKYFDILLVLSTSFFIWGLASLFQTFSYSIWTVLLCRCLVSLSQSSLEPLIQVLAEKTYFKKSNVIRLFGVYYCYKTIGAFLAVSIIALVHIKGNPLYFSINYNKICIFSGVISIIVSFANVSLASSFSFEGNKKHLVDEDNPGRCSNNCSSVNINYSNNYDVGISSEDLNKSGINGNNSSSGVSNDNDEKQVCLKLGSFADENGNRTEKKNSNSNVVLIIGLFVIFLIGVFMLIVREIYGLIQINSSFYIDNTYKNERNGSVHEHVKLSFNITYYTLRSVVYLLGSALGSLAFGMLYGKLYRIYKKKRLSNITEESSFPLGAGNYRHFYFTLISLGTILNILLIVLLNSNKAFPDILGAIANDKGEFSEVTLFYVHLIEIFLTGSTLTIIVDVIIRSEILFISGERSSVALYGSYLALSGILTNSSFYKYIKLFKIDKCYIVRLPNHININMIPTVFHNPIKIFSKSVISDIYSLEASNSFEKVQVTHIDISIYTIILYTTVAIITSWLFIIVLTLISRKRHHLSNNCGVEEANAMSNE